MQYAKLNEIQNNSHFYGLFGVIFVIHEWEILIYWISWIIDEKLCNVQVNRGFQPLYGSSQRRAAEHPGLPCAHCAVTLGVSLALGTVKPPVHPPHNLADVGSASSEFRAEGSSPPTSIS